MAWPHHPKRTTTRVFDRIGQVGVAWSERMWTDAEPEIPDKRPGTRAQHAADLGPGRPPGRPSGGASTGC
jgi:hypothetical protein